MDLFQVLHQMRKYDAGVETSSEETQYTWPSHHNRSTLAKFSTFHKLAVPDSAESRDLHARFEDSPGYLDHRTPRMNLTDQFTWGSVVCAGIFVLVFGCVMTAWWVQKRRRLNSAQRLENCTQESAEEGFAQQQKPPSYSEVVSVQELPPSYSEAIIICRRCNSTSTVQGFDNLAAVLEEGVPERSKVLENHSDDDCIVITVPEHDCCRQSNS